MKVGKRKEEGVGDSNRGGESNMGREGRRDKKGRKWGVKKRQEKGE